MTDTPEPISPAPEPEAQPAPPHPLPASPVERAKLEAQAGHVRRNATEDRTTMVAFGLLFIVPLIIIVLSVLFLLPFINAQLTEDPSGVIVETGPNMPPPAQR